MRMVSAPTRWTAEMVRALPDDHNRFEVIEGELIVTPAPSWTHQRAVERLFIRLGRYLDENRAGYIKLAPADIEFSGDTLVQPDLFVVPRGEGKLPRSWEDVRELLLVVEVLSHSSARSDRLRKRELYMSRGAPEYWIVDVDARVIERWQREHKRPEIVRDRCEWQPARSVEPFVLNLNEYFAEVLDE